MLTMRQKKAVTAEFKGRYAKLSKKKNSRIYSLGYIFFLIETY